MSEILKSLKAWNSFASGGPRPEGPPVRCEEAANEVESLEQRIRELESLLREAEEALTFEWGGEPYNSRPLINRMRKALEPPQ